MNRPIVTIVTPSYNQGPFIRQTIESVLSQDYPNIEYIIMDGASTDETAAIAAEYAGRLTFISEKDRGQSHAINKGFRRAKGEILAWINSDDILLEGAVSRAVKELEENPRAGAIFGEGYLMNREGDITCRFPYTSRFNLYRLVMLSDYILQQTVFIRRSVVEEVGYSREDLHFVMDWEWWIRIGKKYPLHYVPYFFGCLREYPDAKTFSGGHRRTREIRDVLREHSGLWLPPGWMLYGSANLTEHWSRKCDILPGVFSSIGKTLAHLIFGIVVRLTVDFDQGWYYDYWASTRMEYWLPSGDAILQLHGYVPGYPALQGQRIEILCNGKAIYGAVMETGIFTIDIPVSSPDEALRLKITASHYDRPFGDSDRRLSYQLYVIRWNGYDYYPPKPPYPEYAG